MSQIHQHEQHPSQHQNLNDPHQELVIPSSQHGQPQSLQQVAIKTESVPHQQINDSQNGQTGESKESSELMAETVGNSPDLNKFQSIYGQNQAILADQARQLLKKCNDLPKLAESEVSVASQSMASSNIAQQAQIVEPNDGQLAQEHGADKFFQGTKIIHDSVGTSLQQEAPKQSSFQASFQENAKNEFQNQLSGVKQFKNQSNKIGQIQAPERFSTPQKLAVNLQKSIGVSMGETNQDWQNRMHELESATQNQLCNMLTPKEQQFSSEVKLQGNDLKFVHNPNQDLIVGQTQKIPQTDQVPTGQRKLSQNLYEDSNHNQTQNNIIFSEQVNKLDYQEYDPSDSHSNFPINQQLAQINDLLEDNDEDVHVLNQKDTKTDMNQDVDDAASLISSSIIQNSTQQTNGSNLIQPNLAQPQRGQSSCENAPPQFHYKAKPVGAGSNCGTFTSEKVFFMEGHNYNDGQFTTPQIAARNTTLSQSNQPASHPGQGGSNIRHPSMDSRQPLQQIGQIESRGSGTHGTHFPDQFNQAYGLNNHPGAIVASSRKSVYSNQELQKNNYFKEEHQRDEAVPNSNITGASLYQQKLEMDGMKYSGQLSQQQMDDHVDGINQAQSFSVIHGGLSPQKIESPMLQSVGRSLNLSGLRSQDNFQGQRSENVVRERRLTGDEQNFMIHNKLQFGKSYQSNMNKFQNNIERRQDDFGIRLNSVSEDNQQQTQLMNAELNRQLNLNQGSIQDQHDNFQKQNYSQNQSFKTTNNFSYRATTSNQAQIHTRQMLESIEQKNHAQSSRKLTDDPYEQEELLNSISEIQQMSEFNRNKLQGYRSGPNINQSLLNSVHSQNQQAFQNMQMAQDMSGAVNIGNPNNVNEYNLFMQQNDVSQYRKNSEDRQESSYNQNSMQHQNEMQNMQQFYGQGANLKPEEKQLNVNYQFQGAGKQGPIMDMQHQMMVQSQYYASQSQNYQQMSMNELQMMQQQQQHQNQSHINLENEQSLNMQMSQLQLSQNNCQSHQFQDNHGRSQNSQQNIQFNTKQINQRFIPSQMQGVHKDSSNDLVQYNSINSFQGQQQFQGGEILYQQTEANQHEQQNINQLPSFYPQDQSTNHYGMQMTNREVSNSLNQQQSNQNMMQMQIDMRQQQARHQNFGQIHQIINNNSGDIASQDVQIANPNGFRALQQMAAAGQSDQIFMNSSNITQDFNQQSLYNFQGNERAQAQLHKQQTFGKSNQLSEELSDNISPEKDQFEQNKEYSNMVSSSRSSHQGVSKHQSKTAPVAHENSTSQKSSARKGYINSGTDSIHACGTNQPIVSNQKAVGSVQGDQSTSIGWQENTKANIKGVTSRGAASDDGQIRLSSNSHYDSQTSKEYAILSNRVNKQNLKNSVKDVTATASSQKNQSDGNKRKSSMNKGSSGLGLSSSAIPNDVQKDISEDLKNKKQSMSRLPNNKIKSHSNYYDAKSMNEKISFGKSYNDGSQYSSKNSVKSGGNETGGSANLNQNFDHRLNQKSVNILATNNSNYGRKQSYSQGGSQNRNARSNQRMQLNVQTGGGNSNSGQHGSNQSYDEFIAQIQHDIRMAKGDIDKEFNVLDGNIMKLASKKVGSMFLQDYLKNADQQLINKIIDQVDGKLADLMVGKYGNFFCSKLIEYLQPHQRIHFLKQISGKKFVEISCDEKGTWALQNILHAAMKEEEYSIIEETIMRDDNISRLSKDKQGHHMINLIITSYPEHIRDKIFNYICNNFKELAQDQNGLCVMKKIIEYAKKDAAKQKRIVENIIVDSLEYVQHEFGNFVVQEIINLYSFEMCKGIYKQMEGHFQRLSLNKFSSKLIETCIDRAPLELQNQIVNEFCNSPCLSKVVQGNFGNFVLQKSIEKYLKSKHNKLQLIESIVKCLEEVSDYKVQEKWGEQLLVRYINQLDTFPHFSEVDNSHQSEQEFKSFMEQKRQVEILLNQKMKEIQNQHQMQKQFIQNQMQGGKGGHFGGYHGNRGSHGNSFTAKYNSQGGQSSGGSNYINNKHHQRMNKQRGGNKGGQGNQQQHRNSLNSINKDNQGFYDNYNQGGMVFQQSQGPKFDQMYPDQNLNNQGPVPGNYVMAQNYGSNNFTMQQQQQMIQAPPNQNDHFNYPRFEGGSNFGQQQQLHPSEIQNQGVNVMGRLSTGNYNTGPFQNSSNTAMIYQQNRGNDSRNQRSGQFFPQNQQQTYRGPQNSNSFYQETNQSINQVQGRNSNPQPAQFQKKGKQNQVGQNFKIQKGNAQGIQGHGGGQQRKDYKKVFKKANITFAPNQGQIPNQQPRQDFQAVTNTNIEGTGNMSMQHSLQNSSPNLVQAATRSENQLQGQQIGHTMSQQQLDQNTVPSSLFNNDPLGITPNGSSGGTTGRENENDLD